MHIQKIYSKIKFLLFIPLLIYFGRRSLIAFDEGFYALQARWIIEKSNWIGPLWWDQVSSDRTIGIQFLLALSKKFLGDSMFVIYIPILCSAILMLFCTYQIHKDLLDDRYPIYSTLILSTTFLWINYSQMATQDMIFASLVTLGIMSSIKAKQNNFKVNLLLSGIWIGLSFMMKTFLTAIPLLAISPFLIRSKIICRKYFWIGIVLGFLPFILWSYKYILIYSFDTYIGLFEKLIRLSKNNTFTQPPYFYLWNLSINIFPWTLLSILGLFNTFKMSNISRYFLFLYPLFIMFLLSIFSTKTPYYPIQILSLVSINSFIGIKYLIENKNKLSRFIEKFNYIFFAILLSISLIVINFTNFVTLDIREKCFITIGGGAFSIIWIGYNFVRNKNRKLIFSILGPYFLTICLVQSGLITDKSKDLRIAIDNLVKTEALGNKPVEIVKSEISNDESFSKIIKIMIQMPKLGEGINKIDDLKNDQYLWTTSNIEKNNINLDYEIIRENKVFYPWKLIKRR